MLSIAAFREAAQDPWYNQIHTLGWGPAANRPDVPPPGSQPPFGNLYGMDVVVSGVLLQDREIAFNACSYSEVIRLSLDDYLKHVKARVLDFSVPRERKKAA